MGACFDSFAARNAESAREAVKECLDYIDECAWESGHGGYTGTMAECTGVQMTRKSFTDRDEAWSWLKENAEKWGPALGVMLECDGKTSYLFGAWCSS